MTISGNVCSNGSPWRPLPKHPAGCTCDGRSSPAILEKLKGLEAAKAAIDVPERTAVIAPIFQTPPVAAYARQMSALAAALERGDDPEALELARSLIEKVVVQPPRGDDDPPSIEVVGELVALLTAAGVEGGRSEFADTGR